MLLSATTVVWSGLWFAVMWWFVIQFFFDVSLNISCTKPLKRHVVLVRACETRRNPVKKRVEVNQLEAREPRSIKWLAVDVSQWSLLTRWKRPASHWTRRPRTLAASVSFFFCCCCCCCCFPSITFAFSRDPLWRCLPLFRHPRSCWHSESFSVALDWLVPRFGLGLVCSTDVTLYSFDFTYSPMRISCIIR